MRRLIIEALFKACHLVDIIPAYSREFGWHRSTWGCYPLRLATAAANLEHRWGMVTQVGDR